MGVASCHSRLVLVDFILNEPSIVLSFMNFERRPLPLPSAPETPAIYRKIGLDVWAAAA